MLPLLFTATTAYFTTLRLRTYMQPFQQEEYDAPRLLKWWLEKRAVDHLATLGLAIALPFGLLQPQAPLLAAAIWLAVRARQEPNPTVTGKKTLTLTPRATKIWLLASVLAATATALIAIFPVSAMAKVALTIALIQTLPFVLLKANYLLMPLQIRQNRKYLSEAHTILTRLHPTTIGLTGSFGKTSTKYILNHLLASHAPTLATPGSVNTPLGIARVVREQLQPHHQYFLAEMGAYGPGSIARLCKLATPSMSCITAVGQAHYERFKSLETVARAKFEIADATLANGGMCILNIDAIPDHLWQPRVAQAPQSYRLVTARKELLRENDYYIESLTQTSAGLALTIQHDNVATSFTAPIYGMVQAGNLAVAFALAAELGLTPKAIAAAMATVKPAPYRLNVQQAGGQTILDDSYNANPAGFATALETLTLIAHAEAQPRRRVLVTPGMVELGTAHDAEHTRLGTLAAQNADVILAIGPSRIPTFVQAVKASATTELHTFPTLAAAREWMQSHGQPRDVILIANDLPDRYESRWNL
jgi:UDP-N-acetylmuramoyl-tripeptide--D-alanyl-D-alanine ligase